MMSDITNVFVMVMNTRQHESQAAKEGTRENRQGMEMLMLRDVWMDLCSPHGTHISRFLPKHSVFVSIPFVCDFGWSEMLSFDTLIRPKY
jgi:hypothetical protein